jgi:chromosome partitioning protein
MGVVIALVNQKGGSGKSSTCVHFADWLTRQGHSVKVVDADLQRSAFTWLKSLEVKIPCVHMDSPDDLLEQISDLSKEQDFLLIDGPAKLSETTRALLLGTDLAVLPVQPTGLDLHSAFDAVRLIRQARKVRGKLPHAALFLSRAIKGTKLKDESMLALGDIEDMAILPTVIHQRQVIADAFGQNATVFSIKNRAATDSAREYERLFLEILGRLK